MSMNLNELLKNDNVDLKTTLVLRHVPQEPKLRKVLPWLAAEHPEIYYAYQQTQSPRVEKQMMDATHVVSFIGHEASKAVFVGLYAKEGQETFKPAAWKKIPKIDQLLTHGMKAQWTTPTKQWFDLRLMKALSKWKGKLIVNWPKPDIAWSRWSANNNFEVDAILEESILEGRMPEWRDLVFTWDELQAIPKKWRMKLAEWRGIYFILDTKTNKGYVGAAYGSENILGRWLGYQKTGHGNNKRLLTCKPEDLRFSILQPHP
jgi:hypothetical protein